MSSECFRRAPSKIDETRTGSDSREDGDVDGETAQTADEDEVDELEEETHESVHVCETKAKRLEEVGDRVDLNPQWIGLLGHNTAAVTVRTR